MHVFHVSLIRPAAEKTPIGLCRGIWINAPLYPHTEDKSQMLAGVGGFVSDVKGVKLNQDVGGGGPSNDGLAN